MTTLYFFNECLLACAKRGDSAGIARLISQGADPAAKNSRALQYAAEDGHQDCVRLLIPISDPKARFSHALRWASRNGHLECVKLLIPVSDPKAENSYALRWAATNGYVECVKTLMPVSNLAAKKSQALRACAFNGHEECVKFLLEHVAHDGIYQAFREVLARGIAPIVAIFLDRVPRLASPADIPTWLSAARDAQHFELADLLFSIVERRALESSSPSSAPNLSRTASRL